MTGIKRRQILRFIGSLLATLGISQFGLEKQASQILAQNTPRKRALLVGINNYPDPRWIPLQGAVNDVLLQKELLTHRFGFESNEILLLTRPVRNIISSLKCLHHKQLKEYNSFLISHSFSSELN